MTIKLSDPQADRSTMLAAALENYLQLIERGESIDIDGFLTSHQGLDKEALAELRHCIESLEFIAQAGVILSEAKSPLQRVSSGAMDLAQTRSLGDFRLIQEIGRGGMGVVFEAEQISLGRRVALKLLPLAAMLDQRALARFKNEVMAVAQLDHPNIVDIYTVGCERGVHHYAMRYIEGCPLSAIIKEMRRLWDSALELPDSISSVVSSVQSRDSDANEINRTREDVDQAFVETARRSVTNRNRSKNQSRAHYVSIAQFAAVIADALDHAHERGILHRDIKPSNLLIDSSGKPWVTDFGLAHVEAGTEMTMTGDLLGTIRYMSPEQVLGNRVGTDHRADIFSFGVTLYELLTLQLPFDADGREELLRRVAFEQPVAPTRLNPAIPRDLETIVLQCLEKNPADRYATASKLADDLRRFEKDEPIQARRPNTGQRLARWVRKRPGFAASLLFSFLVVSIAFGTSSVLLNAEKINTGRALVRERNLSNQLNGSLAETEQERDKADRHLDKARKAIRRLFSDVSRTELKFASQSETIRHQLMLSAAELYADLIEDAQNDPGLRLEAAEMWIELGRFEQLIGRKQPASIAFQNAIEIFENEPKSNRRWRHDQVLANAYRFSANTTGSNNFRRSLECYRKSEAMFRELLPDVEANNSSDNDEGTKTNDHLDVLLQLGLVLKDMGQLMLHSDQRSEGIAKLNEAQDLLDQLENAAASLAGADIDLVLSDIEPERLANIDQRIETLVEYRSANLFSSDHDYLWQFLEFFDRLYEKLIQTGDKKRANEFRFRAAPGWSRLANKYPTSQLIRSKVTEMELARIFSQDNPALNWRFYEIVDSHLALTNQRPSAHNIGLLIDLLQLEIRNNELFIERNEYEGHEHLVRHKAHLAYAEEQLEYWEQRHRIALDVIPGEAIAIGGPLKDTIRQAVPAATEEIYVIGQLNKGAWFDAYNPNTKTDVPIEFLAIYDATGVFLDHVDVQEICGGAALSLAVDTHSNALIAGNGFVAKLDPDLNLIWKTDVGTTSCIACDATGNVLVCGRSTSAHPFQIEPESLNDGNVALKKEPRGYVAKLSNEGQLLWTWRFGSSDGRERASCIAIGPQGNIYFGGGSTGRTSFGQTTAGEDLVHESQQFEDPKHMESFLAKISPVGVLVWVRHLEGKHSWLQGIVCPGVDEIIFTVSTLSWPPELGPKNHKNHSAIDLDVSKTYLDQRDITKVFTGGYIVTYDRDGHIVREPYHIACLKAIYPKGICIDHRGHIFVTGYFYDRVVFEPGSVFSKFGFSSGVPIATIKGNYDGYLVELSDQGQYVRAWTLSGPGEDRPSSIAADGTGRIITTGSFWNSLITPTGKDLGSAGGHDGYLLILEPRGE